MSVTRWTKSHHPSLAIPSNVRPAIVRSSDVHKSFDRCRDSSMQCSRREKINRSVRDRIVLCVLIVVIVKEIMFRIWSEYHHVSFRCEIRSWMSLSFRIFSGSQDTLPSDPTRYSSSTSQNYDVYARYSTITIKFCLITPDVSQTINLPIDG